MGPIYGQIAVLFTFALIMVKLFANSRVCARVRERQNACVCDEHVKFIDIKHTFIVTAYTQCTRIHASINTSDRHTTNLVRAFFFTALLIPFWWILDTIKQISFCFHAVACFSATVATVAVIMFYYTLRSFANVLRSGAELCIYGF